MNRTVCKRFRHVFFSRERERDYDDYDYDDDDDDDDVYNDDTYYSRIKI